MNFPPHDTAMNFPGSGCISDDAQFFFEDYNFYNAIYAQQQQQQQLGQHAAAPVQQNYYPNGAIPVQHTVIQQVHDPNQINTNGNGTDYNNFSNLIRDTLIDERSQTSQAAYSNVNFDLTPQNEQQTQAHRNRAESISSLDGKKSKSISKSTSSNKVCRVCGDKALGYNFNVVTCESCKAFFRRNALKKKKLQCPFQNRCTITVASRRYCQKCRLRKCFEVGMRAEYIMTEEQRAQKRQRLLERETLEQGNSGAVSPKSDTYGDDVFNEEDFKMRNNNFDSQGNTLSGFGEAKQPSSKSGSDSSEHEENPSTLVNPNSDHSPVDVAAWVNQIPPQQPAATLLSPMEPTATTTNTISASLDTDGDMITIRIPKATLVSILFNSNDRNQQMAALGQAVVASATSSSNPAVQPSKCVCPCTCSTNGQQQTPTSGNIHSNGPSTQPSYASTSGTQTGFPNVRGNVNFSAYSAQNQITQNQNRIETNLSMSSASDSEMALCPSTQNFASSPTASDFDMDFLTSLTTAFNVDWQMPVAFPTFLNLRSKYEQLDELLLANEEWNQYNQAICTLKVASLHDITTEDFFKLVTFALRCVIKQYNRISAFKTLAFEDRQALIKGNVRELFTLRSIMKFDPKKKLANAPPRDSLTLELMKRIRGGVYNEFKQLLASYPEKMRRDETVMLILSAMVLFNPYSPSVVNRDAVKKQQETYQQLLKEYMENAYGAEETNVTYGYLIERVKELVSWVNKYSIRVFFELDPQTMEPALVQVFDFN